VSPTTLALLKLVAIALPLVAVAWPLGIYPSRRLVRLAVVPAATTQALAIVPEILWLVVALDVVLGVAVVIDLGTLPSRKAFGAERHAGRIASLRKRHAVSLSISSRARRPFSATIRDGMPEHLNPAPAEFSLELAPQSRTTVDYVLRPGRRGAFTIGPAWLRIRSRLGLWQRFVPCPGETVIHVYPDVKQLGQYALLARTNRLSLLGVRRTRRVGQHHDFERLRDYTIDDNYKHIEWRATARRRKLTVKDFQASQSQQIVFLLDCGRMMTNEAAGLSLLDHALNATLLLSYVALRQNDSVGLVAFSDEVYRFVPPRSGMNQMGRLLNACFDQFPRLVESRYDLAFRYLAAHSRKRSLVVLVTNVIDEVNARQVHGYLANLAWRHLPLGVLLRDRRMFEAADAEDPQGSAFWEAAAAAEILSWRHQTLTDLAHSGVLVIDAFPDQLTAPLVNRYLEIKARHLL
jgi:uncharacterized protein (DUF58 family)